MRINKLSLEVQSTIRTGISILDLTHCVSELVQNSLDAKATSIAVRLNLENLTIQVVDNGQGLTREELDVIGQRYMTSKCRSIKDLERNLPYYGFRGESLASLIEACSVLMIVSKPEGCEETYSKVFRGGKESNNAVVSTHNRLCTGTTVVVKGFLHNLPVRRARVQPAIEIESVRHCLIALSIINYKVSFTLRNDVTKVVILQTQEFGSYEDAINFHCDLKENHGLMRVSSNKYPFKITAHISKETETSGNFQFIYVNGRLVKNKRIYELVNKHLSKSFSMRNIGKEVKENDDKPKEKSSSVFIIHIQCPFSEYDIVGDPKKVKVQFKQWDFLDKSLENVIGRFVTSDNAFYNMSEQMCNIEQHVEEENLNASNIASHNDHAVKSNLLCGKSVTRPIPILEVLEKNNTVETNENNINNKTAQDSKNTINENEEHFLVKLKKNENRNDEIKQPCHQEINPNKGNASNKKYTPESKECKDKCSRKKTKHMTLASADTGLAMYKKTEMEVNLNKAQKSNISNNHGKKSKITNPTHFKVPETVSFHTKRKIFTEHILTESESDVPPVKKTCRLDTIVSEESGNKKNSKKCILTSSITYSSFKKPYLTEHILTESESDMSYNVPRAKENPLKNKNLTEHILTESESDVPPTKQITSPTPSPSIYQESNRNKKSILPIISHDFFNDAVTNMLQSHNIYHSLTGKSLKTTRQTVQMKLRRSLKKIPNSNSLRITQKHSLKYLDNKRQYITCSKRISSILKSKEVCSTKLESNTKLSNSKLDLPKVDNHEIKIPTDKNININLNYVDKEIVSSGKFNHGWKLFSPAFANVKTSRTKKEMVINKRCKSNLTSSKTPVKHDFQLKFAKTIGREDYTNNGRSKHLSKTTMKLCNGVVTNKNTIQASISKPMENERRSTSKIKRSVSHSKLMHHNHHNTINMKPHYGSKRCSSQYIGSKKDNLVSNHKSSLKIRNHVHFEDFSHINENSDISQFNVKPLTLNNIYSSPVVAYNTDTYPNVVHGDGHEFQRIGYLKELHTSSGILRSAPHITSNEQILFSPTPSFSFFPAVNSRNSLNLHKNLWSESPLISKSNDNLICKPTHIDFFVMSPQQTANRSASNDQLSNIIVPEFKYFQAVADFGRELHERKSLGSHNKSEHYYDLSSSLNDDKHKDWLVTKQLKYAANSTPEVIKHRATSLNDKDNHSKFNIFASDSCRKLNNAKKASELVVYESTKPFTHSANNLKSCPSYIMSIGSNIDYLGQNQFNSKNNYKLQTERTESNQSPKNITNNEIHLHQQSTLETDDVFTLDTDISRDQNKVITSLKNSDEVPEKSTCKNVFESSERISQTTTINWNKEITSSGKVFYINQLTGMSSFTTPNVKDLDMTVALEKRHWFMPKGVSPILNANGGLKITTKPLSVDEKGIVESIINTNNVEQMSVKWRDSSLNYNKDPEKLLHILNENCGNWILQPNGSKKPCKFASESLSSAEVIGQVDRKFIAALLQHTDGINRFLVLLDQHAVDERIQLESLVSGYKAADGLKDHAINQIEINLSEPEIPILKDHISRISKMGLHLVVQENHVVVNTVPLCLFNRYTREKENKEWLSNMVTALVKQLLSSVQDGCGVMPSIPPLLYEIISTEACRGSIKFGDVLTLDLCRLLITKLAVCETPFQCAHGRPVLTPLLEVKQLEHTVEKINLKQLAQRIHSREIKRQLSQQQ